MIRLPSNMDLMSVANQKAHLKNMVENVNSDCLIKRRPYLKNISKRAIYVFIFILMRKVTRFMLGILVLISVRLNLNR
ncbi:hypothetical protein BGS_0281 [Beggiatoa sp. SS]|nr:hypothetical protein BGS_0281 [Beggiatoa sp. SS]